MKGVTAIILAGGQSSRMGQDKGLIRRDGKYMIEYSIAIAKTICDEVLISTANTEYEIFGYPLVEDIYSGIGPIGGIYSAMLRSSNKHCLVLPCDTPHLKPELFESLLSKAAGMQGVVPFTDEDGLEPLCAYYHQSCLSLLKEQIQRKDYKMRNFIGKADIRMVRVDNSEAYYAPGLFANLNTPDDLMNSQNEI